MKFRYLITACALALAGSVNAATIVNGSFEQGTNPGIFTTLQAGSTAITGWSIGGDSVDYIGTLWQAADGSRSLDMSGNAPGTIYQTFATTIGQAYVISFDLAGNGYGGGIRTLGVDVGNGVTQYTFVTTGTSTSNMGWVLKTYNFTATSANTTLTFQSLTAGASGPALDNVSIANAPANVPEPASWAMMIGGFFMVGGVLRGKRTLRLA